MTGSNGSVAGMLNTLFANKLGFDYYDKALTRVQAMTADDLNKIATQYCTTKQMIRVRAGRMPASK
jgi:predicted Zn-dependent peptidase